MPLQIKILKHVTLPILKLGAEPTYLRFDSKVYEAENDQTVNSRAKKDADGNPIEPKKRKMAPPMLAEVTQFVDAGGSVITRAAQIIVNAVLESQLLRKYPADAYVGKTFAITKTAIQGRDYFGFGVEEVQILNAPVESGPAPVADAPNGIAAAPPVATAPTPLAPPVVPAPVATAKPEPPKVAARK